MHQYKRGVLLAILLLSLNCNPAHADDNVIHGSGRSTCSDFINVVDGQWSSPLNAIQFHGYISWAHGMISGFNRYQTDKAIKIDTDSLKLDLVDRCRDAPGALYAGVVEELIEAFPGNR